MSSSGSDAGDGREGQEVDLGDVEISAEPGPPLPVREPSRLPPPLPPSAFVPSVAPPPPATAGGAGEAPMHLAPLVASAPPPGRSPIFYVAILVGVLVASMAVGLLAATARRKAPAAASSTSAASAGAASPRVITIPVVDMNDPSDGSAP